jgi:hypothetical protein
LIQGEGEISYPSGTIYKGNMVNSEKEGYGEIWGLKGEVYKGNFIQGKYNGKGYHKIPDLYEYDGEFHNG